MRTGIEFTGAEATGNDHPSPKGFSGHRGATPPKTTGPFHPLLMISFLFQPVSLISLAFQSEGK
jgi:hypothetical protein